jgi:hypothetical protein
VDRLLDPFDETSGRHGSDAVREIQDEEMLYQTMLPNIYNNNPAISTQPKVDSVSQLANHDSVLFCTERQG